MQQTVVVYLHDAVLNSVSWVPASDNADTPVQAQVGSLDDLTTACSNHKVAVIIPSTLLTFSSLQLPATDRERMLRALPYAMEDRIIDDVDSMHFSIHDWKNNLVNVSAISRQQLEDIIQRFNNAGIYPDYLVPDLFMTPYKENSWTVVITSKYALIRTGHHTGLSVDSFNLPQVLSLNLAQASKLPGSIHVIRKNDSDASTFEQLKADYPTVTFSEEIYSADFVDLFKENFIENTPYNLLQGKYSKHEQLTSLWKAWRPVAIFAGIMLVFYSVSLGVDIHNLNQRIARVDNEITALFKRAVPEARKVINPRAQLQQRISALKQDTDNPNTGFLPLLAKAADHLANNASIKLISLNYKESKLDIELVIDNFQKLDELKSNIEKQGIKAEIISATADDKSVLGRLRLSGKV